MKKRHCSCEQILTAARVVLARREPHELLMDEIAREAGVAKGTLYIYFKSKEEIFLAVALEELKKVCARLQECEKITLPLERLKSMVREVTRVFTEDEAVLRQIFQGGPHDAGMKLPKSVERHMQKFVAIITRAVAACKGRGLPRDINAPETAAWVMTGLRASLASRVWRRVRTDWPNPEIIWQYIYGGISGGERRAPGGRRRQDRGGGPV